MKRETCEGIGGKANKNPIDIGDTQADSGNQHKACDIQTRNDRQPVGNDTGGLYEPGRYLQANPERPFAYDRIEDLCQETVEPDNDEDASSENDFTVDNSSDDDNNNRRDANMQEPDNKNDAAMPQQADTPNQRTNHRDKDQNNARNPSSKNQNARTEPIRKQYNPTPTYQDARNGNSPQKHHQSDEHRDVKQNKTTSSIQK
jgi:hypothetical protein